MAEKGGRFNRFLNAIGFVEVPEEPQGNGDPYANGYAADDYGRQTPYMSGRGRSGQAQRSTPSRSSSSRPGAMVNRGSSGYAPTRPSNDRYGNRGGSNGRSGQSSAGARGGSQPSRGGRQANSGPRQSSPSGYDYSTRPQPQSERPSAPRSRTVMLSLQELTDCCDVIDNLILNNTVVLTMDDLDERTMQRAVDTLSGAVFALHATFRRASAHTFLIAPSGVEVNDQYDPDYRF